jgi:hypothetical protein
MSPQVHSTWIALSPRFPEKAAIQIFREHARQIEESFEKGEFEPARLRQLLELSLDQARGQGSSTALHAALSIVTDLAHQRWSVRVKKDGTVEVKRPDGEHNDPKQEKARIRNQELVKRDEQLRHPATREFVKAMERASIYKGQLTSIFSLIRDGRELAESLRRVRTLPEDARMDALSKVIDPFLQFVDEASTCSETGLKLQDIWRYFRHTWSNQYTSTPGRSMAFLVRDYAREFHPIIGIGAIGSPIMQIRERDGWIGWQPEAFLELALEEPSDELGNWLNKTVLTAIDEIFVEDFVEEALLSPADLRDPSNETINRLVKYGDEQRDLHYRLARSADYKHPPRKNTVQHWRERALSHLYKSKRAHSLAEMLRSRLVTQRFLGEHPTAEAVRQLVQCPEGRQSVKSILRKSKADRVGIAMADITVCGAVAPYTPILGGKLVSMLAASPEVITVYRDKYKKQESEIASSMAGRPIVRPSELVFFGTTSLYGVGSSQYNRLWMPASLLGGRQNERFEFRELGKSEAYGTSHFSTNTVEALVSLVQQSSNGQRVNSIFGEGVSPKLRKIRDGLDALNFPADSLLQHGRQRIVYGVPVVRNLREFLLGMDDKPEYLFDLENPRASTAAIAQWWKERWLSNRIKSNDVLAMVGEHALVRPVRHGARVVLPAIEDGQGVLFDELPY